MEETEADAQLLQLHRLGAGGFDTNQPQRWSDHHEQHGAKSGAASGIQFFRLILISIFCDNNYKMLVQCKCSVHPRAFRVLICQLTWPSNNISFTLIIVYLTTNLLDKLPKDQKILSTNLNFIKTSCDGTFNCHESFFY